MKSNKLFFVSSAVCAMNPDDPLERLAIEDTEILLAAQSNG
jgi:hypothetical protein